VGRNKKSERMLVARWELDRAFTPGLHQRFEVCSRLLFLFITSSDKLSRKNILYSENCIGLFRDNLEFQKDPLFEARVLQLGDALRRAKDRLVNRESKREEKKEIKARKEERKTKHEPPPVPATSADFTDLLKRGIAELQKENKS
jgi:hypothetical protein